MNITDKQVGFQFIEKQVVVHKQKIDKHEQKISLHEEKIAELELIIKVLLQKDLEWKVRCMPSEVFGFGGRFLCGMQKQRRTLGRKGWNNST